MWINPESPREPAEHLPLREATAMLPSFLSLISDHIKSTARPFRAGIHSGKLGDIIYALPTCQALGINHLFLCVVESSTDPLKNFPSIAAQSIVPLLLAQSYIDRVTIVRSAISLDEWIDPIFSIPYNFDRFRNVARHRIGRAIEEVPRVPVRWLPWDVPAHLIEHFAAIHGIEIRIGRAWLKAPPSPRTHGKVVVSLTHNWRSYSHSYWKYLLAGLEVCFVGHKSEWERAEIPNSRHVEAHDHLELASLIHGAKLFLGTVSFPYAIAEGLQIPRMVEVCFKNLNAFPVGGGGAILPPNVCKARKEIETYLEGSERARYQGRGCPLGARMLSLQQEFASCGTWANRTWKEVVRFSLVRAFKYR